MDIEAFLAWAYKRELPKAAPDVRTFAPGAASAGFAAFGSMAAVQNGFGVICDFTADGPPHPDAVLVAELVSDLDECGFEPPEGWDPVPDLGLSDAELDAAVAGGLENISVLHPGGERRLRRPVSMMIIHHALLGGCPDWQAEAPKRRLVTAHGKPKWFRMVEQQYPTVDGGMVSRMIEVDGYNTRAKRPFPNAYQKTRLDPDPAVAVAERAEYEIWRSALAWLSIDLAGRCVGHEVCDSARTIRPWEDGEAAPPRVLPDLSTFSAWSAERRKPLALKPKARRDTIAAMSPKLRPSTGA